MVQLLSINRIDVTEEFSGGTSVNINNTDDERNGDCRIDIEPTLQISRHIPGRECAGTKTSQSLGNFDLKKTTINIKWKNIFLTTKKDTQILKNLSGAVCSGELTAIMGPSGAGKTSLLNVLSGFTRHKVTGQILVNGTSRELRVFRKLASYILQDDHILPCLTVREIVSIAANLKIPSTVSKQERKKAVNNCLQCLGLAGLQNQKAKNLSGGQRKRLCIAQELVSNPPLIFLDEPTSGLDSASCFQCVQLLKSLANEGRTVVCTVHQPSSKIFEMFDSLYMLAEGQCIYRGSTQNLVPFLSKQDLNCPQYYNPADYVTELAMGDYGDWNSKLKDAIDISDNPSETCSISIHMSESRQELNIQSSTISLLQKKCTDKPLDIQEKQGTKYSYATSSFNQFRIILYRNILCTIREPTNIQLKIFGNSLLSLLLGALYYGIGNDASKVYSNSVLLFCVVTFLIVCAKIPTVLTFPMKRIIFEREQMNSWYSTGTYYLGTTAAEIPFQLFYPIISTSIVYWMTDQPNDITRFGLFLLSAIIITLVSESIGQFIGVLSASVLNGTFLATLSSMHTLLFCGFFISISNMPSYLQWLSYTSFGRYAFQSVLLICYAMDRPPLNCNKPTVCPYENPTQILKQLELEGELYIDYAIMLGYFFFFRILAYLALKFRVARMK